MPLVEGWALSSAHRQGLGKQGTLGDEGAVMGHPETDGVRHLWEPPGEPWAGCQGIQLYSSFAV